MKQNYKKFIFIFSVIFLFLSQSVLALETKFPRILGFTPPDNIQLPQLIIYIFNFSMVIAGAIAVISIVIAGFQYIASAGEPDMIGDAKDRITSAVLGFLLLITSFLIMRTINPDLVAPAIPLIAIDLPAEVDPLLFAGVTYRCNNPDARFIQDCVDLCKTFNQDKTNSSAQTLIQLCNPSTVSSISQPDPALFTNATSRCNSQQTDEGCINACTKFRELVSNASAQNVTQFCGSPTPPPTPNPPPSTPSNNTSSLNNAYDMCTIDFDTQTDPYCIDLCNEFIDNPTEELARTIITCNQ